MQENRTQEVHTASDEEKSDLQLQREPNALPISTDSRAHILVVEDQPQMVRMITAALASRYRVTSACDGQEGLEQATALLPDLIHCDVLMPRMNGEQLVTALRGQSVFDNVPIVVISGRTDEQLRIQLLRAGAQDFLVKPFHHEELRLRIANLLMTRQVRQILQREVVSQSQNLVELASEVTQRQQELTRALSLLQDREADVKNQAIELERRRSELERLEADRQQREIVINRLASIVESSNDAISSITLEGVITSWNSGAENLYGYTADEIIGQSIALFIPPDLYQELPPIRERIKVGLATKYHERTQVRKDGTLIEVSVTISPILDIAGSIIGVSRIARDITEQKRMAEAATFHSREVVRMNTELIRQYDGLIALNVDLVNSHQVREQFLATMSHELRTPLTSIIGFGEMLLDEALPSGWNQEQQNTLQRILKNGEHLLGLINNVLDMSKLDAGRMAISYSPVNVRSLLTAVTEEIQSIAIARNLVLRIEVEEGIDCLETNPMKLHQLLLNLVANALKFTNQGEVLISATQVFCSDKESKSIAFAVKDTGIGISPDIQKQIFEPFYQLDGTYSRKYGGTGLGLSIVSKLTALLGGTITVESILDQGSTFTVILPITTVSASVEYNNLRLHPMRQQEVSSHANAPIKLAADKLPEYLADYVGQEATGGQQPLIMVVDDNEDSIILIKAALRDLPYRIVGVQDPLKVIELIHTLQPSAITLDVMMPELNGWQLLYQLKDNPTTSSIPVILVTVLAEQATGYVLGADDYLVKPFEKEEFCNVIQRVIEEKTILSHMSNE